MKYNLYEYNNKDYIIYDLKNHEDMGSCCYNREYYLIPIDKIDYNKAYTTSDLESIIEHVTIKGVTRNPVISKDDSVTISIDITYKFSKHDKVNPNNIKCSDCVNFAHLQAMFISGDFDKYPVCRSCLYSGSGVVGKNFERKVLSKSKPPTGGFKGGVNCC